MREAFDELRDLLAPVYEREASPVFLDPWGARDRFAEVLVRRTPRVENLFLGDRHSLIQRNGAELTAFRGDPGS